MRIGLVGCVKSKTNQPCPARDLYTSPLFLGRRRWVEDGCDRWYILSAKHGLVAPDTWLEPYDETLTNASLTRRRIWAKEVLAALRADLRGLSAHTFEIHAGAAYRDHGLVQGLLREGAKVEVAAAGLSLGQQIGFYGRSRTNATHALSPLLERERHSGAGRPAISASYSGTYLPLHLHMANAAAGSIEVSFADMERILGRALPASARRHRAWWANDPSHSQALAWLSAGWEIEKADLAAETVRFRRRS